MRERIKKEVLEWESAEDRARREESSQNTMESDDDEDMANINNEKLDSKPETADQPKDPMHEAVTDQDAYKLAKSLESEDKLWEVFALRTLRLKVQN